MTSATATRSAYPPAVDELMPRAIELTKTLGGELPSRNRLMKELRIGSDKAKAVLAELRELADRDERVSDLWAAKVRRGSLVDRPPMHLVPNAPAEPLDVPTLAVGSPDPAADGPIPAPIESAAAAPDVDPAAISRPVVDDDQGADVMSKRKPVTWPVFLLCLPAFVAIWGGWVEMGRLTGFGKVTLLPGIADGFHLNTAITLPVGVETYAAYALFVWLSGRASGEARRFAKWSALGSLALGGLGQIAYHLMNAAGWSSAPWEITAAVSCIPVAVLGMGAALAHLMHRQ